MLKDISQQKTTEQPNLKAFKTRNVYIKYTTTWVDCVQHNIGTRKSFIPAGNRTTVYVLLSHPVSSFNPVVSIRYRLGWIHVFWVAFHHSRRKPPRWMGAVSFRCVKSRGAYVPRKWNVPGTTMPTVTTSVGDGLISNYATVWPQTTFTHFREQPGSNLNPEVGNWLRFICVSHRCNRFLLHYFIFIVNDSVTAFCTLQHSHFKNLR